MLNISAKILRDMQDFKSKGSERTQILKQNYLAGQILELFNNPDIRQLVEENYVIIYQIKDESRIDILSVHHSARDLSKRKKIF